MPPWLIQI